MLRSDGTMSRFLLICFGGALGTGARYLLSGWVLRSLGAGFPLGTLSVNVIGSFLLAVIMHVGLTTGMLSPDARLVLGTGVMGGFTTYSTFNYETMQYMQEGAFGLAALNVAVTLVACLAAGGLGIVLGRWIAGS
jgi:fluoride exporter